jgi:glycosyltransferase involved in cell wall biosynthesis
VRPRPRVLFLSSARYDLPLQAHIARGWEAIDRRLDVRVIARRGHVDGVDRRFRLVDAPVRGPAGRLYYARLFQLAVREARSFRPDVVVAQSPFEAFAFLAARPFLRRRPKLLVQVHGDWRTAARLYGSRLRQIAAPIADRAALAALRRADGTRAVGPSTALLARDATGREPLGIYPTYFDLDAFTRAPPRPLPREPAAAWVAVLERSKNVGGFAHAWRSVMRRLPGARLVMVGQGRLEAVVEQLVHEFPDRVRAVRALAPPDVARLLDESTLLVLPSLSEGTPRVILEAFARGRPVVATAVGGIPDLVVPEKNGLLVPAGDSDALADALVRLLGNRELAERLARGASETSEDLLRWTPDRFAEALAETIYRVMDERRHG